jgi:hypothetical protein
MAEVTAPNKIKTMYFFVPLIKFKPIGKNNVDNVEKYNSSIQFNPLPYLKLNSTTIEKIKTDKFNLLALIINFSTLCNL